MPEFRSYLKENKEVDVDACPVNFLFDNNTNFDVRGDFVINWEVGFEVRDWGIKSIDVSILNVSGVIYFNEWTEGEDIEHEFTLQQIEEMNRGRWIEDGNVRTEFKIENNVDVQSMICLQNIYIDVSKGVIKIT